MWLTKVQSLGDVRAYKKVDDIVFTHDTDTEVLKNSKGSYQITTSCGCTGANYNPITRELRVSYNPGGVPIHLKQNGIMHYTSTKTITVMCKNKSTGQEVKEILTFTANVFE
jgi:hypothetical protein